MRNANSHKNCRWPRIPLPSPLLPGPGRPPNPILVAHSAGSSDRFRPKIYCRHEGQCLWGQQGFVEDTPCLKWQSFRDVNLRLFDNQITQIIQWNDYLN